MAGACATISTRQSGGTRGRTGAAVPAIALRVQNTNNAEYVKSLLKSNGLSALYFRQCGSLACFQPCEKHFPGVISRSPDGLIRSFPRTSDSPATLRPPRSAGSSERENP